MPSTTHHNTGRIAKNTLLLYFRMIVVMVVTFFTARITLQILGVEDYGIQNVVGSLVVFMQVIGGSMTSATQRFLAYALGENDIKKYKRTFGNLLSIFLLLSLLVIAIGEPIGLWMVQNKLVIPIDRIYASQWVFHCSLISFVISLITIPFTSSIIASERMGIYAYLSLYDAVAKMVVVYLLYISPYDKLISLTVLHLIINITYLFIHIIYCVKKIEGCVLHFYHDKNILSTLLSYTGWNLFGSLSSTLNVAGISIVINLFCGPVVNAAKAIADKINHILVSFSNNFYQAVSPQIVKTYAAHQLSTSLNIVYKSSKFSFFLLYVISLPMLLFMDLGLSVWLGEDQITSDMIVFSRYMLIYSLVVVLEPPLSFIIRATGDIKRYQIYVGIVTLLSVPLAYMFFLFEFPSYFCIVALITTYFIAHIVRLYILHNQVSLSYSDYVKKVLLPILLVVLITLACSLLIQITIATDNVIVVVIKIAIIEILTIVCMYRLGMTRTERLQISTKIKQILHNKLHSK